MGKRGMGCGRLQFAGRSASARSLVSSCQSGFVLLSVLFLVALILLSLAVAAPRIIEEIRRDRENEFYHRGMQYQRAIKLYYRKFGRYPVSIDQLEKTNEIRFLRKRYKDPITGKDEWRLIHLGQAKVPPMGFFGQPLTVGLPAAALGSGSSDATAAKSGAISADSQTSGAGAAGASTDTSSGNGSLPGGGPIVGVSSNSPKESIRVYKKQTHYNEWEFVYDPSQERGMGGLGASRASPGTGPTGNPAPTQPPVAPVVPPTDGPSQ